MVDFLLCIGRQALRALHRIPPVAIWLMLVAPAYAGNVSLTWDPVASSQVAGYTVHYGPTAGNYTNAVDVGKVTTATINNLTEGATYHFVVAAYDAAHSEGALSNNVAATVSYTVPVASFSASTVSGVAPLALNFMNQSTGTITSYAWTFGDGTTSNSQNPSKVYLSAGVYTVKLTVSGPDGTNSLTKANYVTVTAQVDTTPPSPPASLAATASGSAAINLSWSASTDNVGVTGHRIERCTGAGCTNFAQIATSTATTFSNTGLVAGTTYRYRVRADDAAGNLGGYSPIATATTASAADTTLPSAPTTLSATASGSAAINLSWSTSTDNVGVTGYRVERCQGAGCTGFAQIATPTVTRRYDRGLAAGTTYRYRVRANDAAGNLGGYSPIATATTPSSADKTPPSAPGTLSVTPVGSTSANLSWDAATDNVGVTGYRVERCQGTGCSTFAQVATPAGTSFADSGLTAATNYSYRVRAADAAGNLGAYSSIGTITTGGAAAAAIPIAYVQNNYATPQTPQSSVAVAYKSTQTAGNLNVIVVGWNDTTAAVTSVTDSNGNLYTRAVGPTTYSNQLSQSIYYATNIVGASANSNVVTVTFSAPAIWADIRVVEYSGIDRTNPVDVVAVGAGSGSASTTSAVTTTDAKDLLFAANTVRTLTTGPGSGFTNRVITVPDGDIVQDRVVNSVGSYSASAPMTSGTWVIQMVAFRGMP